jgi:hypothetical protein
MGFLYARYSGAAVAAIQSFLAERGPPVLFCPSLPAPKTLEKQVSFRLMKISAKTAGKPPREFNTPVFSGWYR